jgi:hypothetical protein
MLFTYKKCTKLLTSDIPDILDKINLMSSNDSKLKLLGEILSNESSRKIFVLLTTQKLSAEEISMQTNLQLSLIIHHLNKMLDVGLITINNIGKNSKNRDVKYYVAKTSIMIFPDDVLERAKTSKLFSNTIRKIFRFSSIGMGGIVTWFVTSIATKSTLTLDRPFSSTPSFIDVPIVIGLIVVILGIIIERTIYYFEIKKRKRVNN